MSQKGFEISNRSKDDKMSSSQTGIEIHHVAANERSMSLAHRDVYLVMDCSGSMAGPNIRQARRGAFDFVKSALAKGFDIGIIEFHSHAFHVCEPTKQLSLLHKHLEQMHVGAGSTNMAEAISLAHEKLISRNGNSTIVLVTDGIPDNIGKALMQAEKAKSDNIDIIAIGTDDADQDFLKKLASRSELGMKVSKEELGASISSSVKLLGQVKRDPK